MSSILNLFHRLRVYPLQHALIILISLFSCQLNARAISFAGSDWCPYICTDPKDPQQLNPAPGILVEIVEQILAPTPYKMEHRGIPWSRGLIDVRRGKTNGILGLYKSDAPDFLYLDIAPMRSQSCFFTRRAHSFKYTGVSSIKGYRVGVTQDYTYDDAEFDQYIKQMKQLDHPDMLVLTGTDSLQRLLELLLSGRIDALVEDTYVVKYLAQKKGVVNQVKASGCLREFDIHFAFSPNHKHSQTYLNLFNAGMRKLQQEGITQSIIDKYLSN